MKKIDLFIILFVLLIPRYSPAQGEHTSSREVSISLEVRPRLEYRLNNIQPPDDIKSPSFLTTQRNRLTLSYGKKDKWLLKAEPQEIHILNDQNSRSAIANINFFQLYYEKKYKTFNFRFGRQSVLLDNGRLFSDAPWAQQGRSHEGLLISRKVPIFEQDFFFLVGRDYPDKYIPAYSPVSSHRYKYLFILHNKGKIINDITFNNINVIEIFDNPSSTQGQIVRTTLGGRIEFTNKRFYSTLNGFFQFGQNTLNQNVAAFYLQPEVRFQLHKNTIRVGAELISGNSSNMISNRTNNFDIRYGVAWKFMGNMNLFTRFPNDVNGKGLFNPYLFSIFPLSKNLSVRSDFHLFYTQIPFDKSTNPNLKRYLGYENDLSMRYKMNKSIELNGGFSYYFSSSLMKNLGKIPNIEKVSIWSYVMVSYSFGFTKSILRSTY